MKQASMTAEECVLLAVALDFQSGMAASPLLSEAIHEIAVVEEKAMNIIRILIVTGHKAVNR